MTAHPCFHQSVRFFWFSKKVSEKASPCLGIDPPLFRGTIPPNPSIRSFFDTPERIPSFRGYPVLLKVISHTISQKSGEKE